MSKYEAKFQEIDAINLYKNGKLLKDIAQMVGCAQSTVSAYLKKHDVDLRQSGIKRKIYPIGFTIGNWKVISEESIGYRDCKQLCECIVCGYQEYVNISHAISRPSKRCVKCKSSKFVNDVGETNYLYIMTKICDRIKYNSERRDKVSQLEFNITPQYLLDLYNKQDGKCALSKINLPLNTLSYRNLNLSLDRIDSNKGYVIGNVQWVDKRINMMKQSFSQDEFINMCIEVAKSNGYSKCN